jgi:hypothetical protein
MTSLIYHDTHQAMIAAATAMLIRPTEKKTKLPQNTAPKMTKELAFIRLPFPAMRAALEGADSKRAAASNKKLSIRLTPCFFVRVIQQRSREFRKAGRGPLGRAPDNARGDRIAL